MSSHSLVKEINWPLFYLCTQDSARWVLIWTYDYSLGWRKGYGNIVKPC